MLPNAGSAGAFHQAIFHPIHTAFFYIRRQNSGLLGKERYLWQDTWAAFYRLNNATRALLFTNSDIKRIHGGEVKIASPRNDLTSLAVLREGYSMVAPIFLSQCRCRFPKWRAQGFSRKSREWRCILSGRLGGWKWISLCVEKSPITNS